jgi:hypothetical protein
MLPPRTDSLGEQPTFLRSSRVQIDSRYELRQAHRRLTVAASCSAVANSSCRTGSRWLIGATRRSRSAPSVADPAEALSDRFRWKGRPAGRLPPVSPAAEEAQLTRGATGWIALIGSGRLCAWGDIRIQRNSACCGVSQRIDHPARTGVVADRLLRQSCALLFKVGV